MPLRIYYHSGDFRKLKKTLSEIPRNRNFLCDLKLNKNKLYS